MWTLSVPWYELVFRASSVFIFIFVVFRVWGKKHFGQLTPFDFILLLIMSEAVQNALVKDDKSVSGSMITILTMVFLNIFLNKLSFYFPKAERILDGEASVIVKDGKIDSELMNKETITMKELLEALRRQGINKIGDVGLATMETNGEISVVKKADL